MRDYASIALRLALGLTFLYAIADRFGALGPPGTPNISWGNFSRFTAYVGTLNWYVPHLFVPALAWVETVLETLLGIGLVLGVLLRQVAFVSALLLLSFALTMAVAVGIGAPLAASVFTASAAAFMLAVGGSERWSIL
ncbi:MAG: MauE/DoxX family redox-associated membrane protein [Candidatus Cybelea sp.]